MIQIQVLLQSKVSKTSAFFSGLAEFVGLMMG